MRSDPELQRDVEDQLARDPTLHAEQMGVRVLNGVVTLTGAMRSDVERWQAADAVRSMPGVLGLNDETMIFVAPASPDLDGDVARHWFPPRG
jgi:osmotically-inducible protein OsmY